MIVDTSAVLAILFDAHVARQAYAEFGKGRHRAGLDFGDCFAYALAKTTGEKLLFKGDDFRKTDVESAL
ncbi:MAG TPA: type II toxin-antitoxin system VapC family toxin [Burkholderiaceae bacterium]|nr:type II toxin-antitoxin system VapC family toxin [Burkholderiaceae bacterium]